MENKIPILKLEVSIDFTEEAMRWLKRVNANNNLWFAKEGGKNFLKKHEEEWKNILEDESDQVIQNYFSELGFEEQFLPKTKITYAGFGSWDMEAVAFINSIPFEEIRALIECAYEAPIVMYELKKLEYTIKEKFHKRTNEKARALLSEQAEQEDLSTPPDQVIEMKKFDIDTSPLEALLEQ